MAILEKKVVITETVWQLVTEKFDGVVLSSGNVVIHALKSTYHEVGNKNLQQPFQTTILTFLFLFHAAIQPLKKMSEAELHEIEAYLDVFVPNTVRMKKVFHLNTHKIADMRTIRYWNSFKSHNTL